MHEKVSAARGKRVCASCVRNKHKMCDGHNFDQFEPSIHDTCECACEQRIGRQYERTIDLIEALDHQVSELNTKLRKQTMLISRAAQVADDSIEVIRKFDMVARDDEGNFLVGSKSEHVDIAINDLLARISDIADEGAAVISALTISDDQDETHNTHADCVPGDGCTAIHDFDAVSRLLRKGIKGLRAKAEIAESEDTGWPL